MNLEKLGKHSDCRTWSLAVDSWAFQWHQIEVWWSYGFLRIDLQLKASREHLRQRQEYFEYLRTGPSSVSEGQTCPTMEQPTQDMTQAMRAVSAIFLHVHHQVDQFPRLARGGTVPSTFDDDSRRANATGRVRSVKEVNVVKPSESEMP